MGIQTKFFGRLAGTQDVASVTAFFATASQGDYFFYFPFPVTITKIRSQVVVPLSATDAGTITGSNASGASAGIITHAASAPFADLQSVVPTTNITVAAGSYYKITTAKTTGGGQANVTIEFKRT